MARTADWSLLYVYFQGFMTLGRAFIRIHRGFQPIKDSSNNVSGCGSWKHFSTGDSVCPRCFTCSNNASCKKPLVFFSLPFFFFFLNLTCLHSSRKLIFNWWMQKLRQTTNAQFSMSGLQRKFWFYQVSTPHTAATLAYITNHLQYLCLGL